MKGLQLGRIVQMIGPTEFDLVDLGAERVSDLFFETKVHLRTRNPRLPELLDIFQARAAYFASDRNQCAGERPAGLTAPDHAAGEARSCFKDTLFNPAQLGLQSCKHGLRSPKVRRLVMGGKLSHLSQELLAR